MSSFLPSTVLFGWAVFVAGGGTGIVLWLVAFCAALTVALCRALPRYYRRLR